MTDTWHAPLRPQAANLVVDLVQLGRLQLRRLRSSRWRTADRAAVFVIAHTHWDREWYRTAAEYRPRLIRLLERVMTILESDPEFRSFTLDGQVAPVDDYLATIEPDRVDEVEKRLRHLIAGHRLWIGPWYTAPDLFLVSGETLLRNLELGMARARKLGATLEVGYFPDAFGLTAELPKILAQVGIHRIIGERGMRSDFPQRFRWRAADGSVAEVYNLTEHYGHARPSPRLIHAFQRAGGGSHLLLAGDDHALPDPHLPRVVARAGAQLASLPEFWDSLGSFQDTLIHEGEIRFAGRTNLLANVASNRVDQRLATASAERLLERYATVMATLVSTPYPRDQIDQAWRGLILNAAHDSACATGIDAVARDVGRRIDAVTAVCERIIDRANGEMGRRMALSGTYGWNPSPWSRDLVVRDETSGELLAARDVPPLGWGMLSAARQLTPRGVRYRMADESDIGDVYTFEPGPVAPHDVVLPVGLEAWECEPFVRMRVCWTNTTRDHRVRLHLALPEPAADSIADAAFGSVRRPAVPDLVQGRDRLNGFIASRFIVAGGLAVLLDRTTEYELLPESKELALTLVRSHGRLSRWGGEYRPDAAGPLLTTEDTQMLKEISWSLGVLPWDHRGCTRLPWREWEQFALPPVVFRSAGGGDLAPQGTLVGSLPDGVLSSIEPGRARFFEAAPPHRITTVPFAVPPPSPSIERDVS